MLNLSHVNHILLENYLSSLGFSNNHLLTNVEDIAVFRI